MAVSNLVNAEKMYNTQLMAAKGRISVRIQHALQHAQPLHPPETPPEATSLPPGILSAPVSANTYSRIRAEYTSRPMRKYPIQQSDIEEARSYVESLLDVDLASVRVEVIPHTEWDIPPEAMLLREGTANHLILIPELCDCPPNELLVHEFGHAGHHTAQRQNDHIQYYWTRPVTAEFVAHFCQYNFILDRLGSYEFSAALGQFVTATYALTIGMVGAKGNFKKFLQAPESQALQAAWPMEDIQNTFAALCQNKAYFADEFQRGIAQLLALALVDERDAMRRFIRLDRLDLSLLAKLEAANFPATLVEMAGPTINEQVANLYRRFDH